MQDVSHALRLAGAARLPRFRPGHHLPMLALVFGLALVAALLVTKIGLAVFEVYVRDADKTPEPALVEVVVGDTALSVPGNMIRFAQQRGGRQERLELFMHWPSLTGFSLERAGLFQADAAESPVIYLDFRPAAGVMAPEDRFRMVYPRVLEPALHELPGGIVVRRFRAGFGYDGEELYIARDARRPLVARCAAEAGPADRPACMVDMRLDGLDVTYRFRREQADDWREIDATVRGLVSEFRRLAEAGAG